MNLLLSANFMRLRKSRAFWVSMAVMAGAGLFEAAAGYFGARGAGMDLSLDSRYLIFALVVGVVLSAFVSLFVGAEYSDGAIRRKVMAGHPRGIIYLANLLTCALAGVLLCLGYILPVLAAGVPLLGWFRLPPGAVAWFTFCAFVMTAALAAFFVLIAMLNQNKAVSAVVCIFLAYFLLFLGIYLHSRLAEPEMMPAREYVENGQIMYQAAYPNPGYVQGVKRTVYTCLRALPGCQAVWLAASAEGCPWQLPLASVLAAAVSAGAGIVLFRRKDLK